MARRRNRKPEKKHPKRRREQLPAVELLPEPMLEFQYGQLSPDPREGLALFGPWDSGMPEQPKRVSYAVIGPPDSIASFRDFLFVLRTGAHKALPDLPETADESERERVRSKIEKTLRLWPTYPSFESAFRAEMPTTPAKTYEVDRAKLLVAADLPNPYGRVAECVAPYLENIKLLSEREQIYNLAFCIVPDVVHKNCRAESKVGGKHGAKTARDEIRDVRRGQSNLFMAEGDREKYEYAVDFRRQLKGRAMEFGIPIQIVRESTLRPNDDKKPGTRHLTPLSDRAWNLTTTGYYKAGGRPWRLHGVREGVCYIGIAFKRFQSDDSDRSACSAAQMFLDTGDGVVFRGTDGKWWSPEHKQFHLTGDAARDLLAGVIETYRELDGPDLKEVFVHSRSDMDDDELKGLNEACPQGAKLVVVRIRQARRGFRLYREGGYPVIRGTYLRRTARSCFLWTSGFKPESGTYDGWETPVPLDIRIRHGDADIQQVAKDVLGLTKLNYNACKLGESEPVTIKFSDVVGEILVSNPGIKKPEAKFRFYI